MQALVSKLKRTAYRLRRPSCVSKNWQVRLAARHIFLDHCQDLRLNDLDRHIELMAGTCNRKNASSSGFEVHGVLA